MRLKLYEDAIKAKAQKKASRRNSRRSPTPQDLGGRLIILIVIMPLAIITPKPGGQTNFSRPYGFSRIHGPWFFGLMY